MKPRFTGEQIIQMIKEQEAGERTADVCRRYGIPNSTFKVKQAWIAASLKRSCLPRLPLGGGIQTRSTTIHVASYCH